MPKVVSAKPVGGHSFNWSSVKVKEKIKELWEMFCLSRPKNYDLFIIITAYYTFYAEQPNISLMNKIFHIIMALLAGSVSIAIGIGLTAEAGF